MQQITSSKLKKFLFLIYTGFFLRTELNFIKWSFCMYWDYMTFFFVYINMIKKLFILNCKHQPLSWKKYLWSIYVLLLHIVGIFEDIHLPYSWGVSVFRFLKMPFYIFVIREILGLSNLHRNYPLLLDFLEDTYGISIICFLLHMVEFTSEHKCTWNFLLEVFTVSLIDI